MSLVTGARGGVTLVTGVRTIKKILTGQSRKTSRDFCKDKFLNKCNQSFK